MKHFLLILENKFFKSGIIVNKYIICVVFFKVHCYGTKIAIYPFKTSYQWKEIHKNEFSAIISKDNILCREKLNLLATTELSNSFLKK